MFNNLPFLSWIFCTWATFIMQHIAKGVRVSQMTNSIPGPACQHSDSPQTRKERSDFSCRCYHQRVYIVKLPFTRTDKSCWETIAFETEIISTKGSLLHLLKPRDLSPLAWPSWATKSVMNRIIKTNRDLSECLKWWRVERSRGWKRRLGVTGVEGGSGSF